ncbi:MAG: hypothetical protein AABZ62_02730, partial [Planctomycetota bacterium]
HLISLIISQCFAMAHPGRGDPAGRPYTTPCLFLSGSKACQYNNPCSECTKPYKIERYLEYVFSGGRGIKIKENGPSAIKPMIEKRCQQQEIK